jgi:hypothetical protein
MKPIRLLIAAVILAGLAGAVWWSNKQEAAKEAKAPVDTTPKILALEEPGIQAIEIHQRDANVTTVLKREGAGKWSITAPKPLAADQGSVASITAAVANLRADRLLDDPGSDLASFGLDPAAVSVTFTDKSGKATKLLIGEATPTGNNVYAKVDGDNRVYTMASSHKTDLDKASKDLRERHLLISEQDKTAGLEVTAKGQSISFAHAGDTWQILKPKALRADGTQVEEVLRKVRDATMDAEAAEKDAAKVAAGFAGATPVATVRVTDPAGPKTLEIRKGKDDCYAKSSMLEGVYKANKDLCDGMDKQLDAYRNKKLFDFGFNDPTRVEFKDGAKNAVYEKGKDGWTSGGKAMDSIAIQNLIDKLRDASASKLVDSGFTAPTMEIGITAGKLNEKVQIAAVNGMFFAHREGDSTTYQVEPSTVEDLRSAAGGIQPASDKKQDKK